MSECILFYTKLHCDWSLAGAWGGGGGEVLEGGAYTGMCRWQGIVFDLSVLNWVYNFV